MVRKIGTPLSLDPFNHNPYSSDNFSSKKN